MEAYYTDMVFGHGIHKDILKNMTSVFTDWWRTARSIVLQKFFFSFLVF